MSTAGYRNYNPRYSTPFLSVIVIDPEQEALRGGLLLPAGPDEVPVAVGGAGEPAQPRLLLLLVLLLLGPGQTQHLLLGTFNILLPASLPCTDPARNFQFEK